MAVVCLAAAVVFRRPVYALCTLACVVWFLYGLRWVSRRGQEIVARTLLSRGVFDPASTYVMVKRVYNSSTGSGGGSVVYHVALTSSGLSTFRVASTWMGGGARRYARALVEHLQLAGELQ